MPSKYERLSPDGIEFISIHDRKSLVNVDHLGEVRQFDAAWAKDFLAMVPPILAGVSIREVVEGILNAKRDGKPVILTMGAHVI